MSLTLTVSRSVLDRYGLAILELINENIEQAIDADDRPFAPYSTRPFSRPAGGIPRRALMQLDDAGELAWFKKGTNRTWVVIEGGYLSLKRAISGRTQVDLVGQNLMLNSMGVLKVEDGAVVIGFRNKEAAERAFYHNVQGAGPSRTIRKFLGLTEEKYKQALENALDGADASTLGLEGTIEI